MRFSKNCFDIKILDKNIKTFYYINIRAVSPVNILIKRARL